MENGKCRTETEKPNVRTKNIEQMNKEHKNEEIKDRAKQPQTINNKPQTHTMSYYSTPDGKDQQLWHTARKRASFKSHLMIYVIINVGLWLLWYFTGARTYGNSIPWPAWTTFGWGIGLLFHYISAYTSSGENAVEKEYKKLTQNNPNNLNHQS